MERINRQRDSERKSERQAIAAGVPACFYEPERHREKERERRPYKHALTHTHARKLDSGTNCDRD